MSDPLTKAKADFINTITLGLQIVGVILLVALALFVWHARKGEDTCEAPCAVKFPKGTQEDDFTIDYRGGKLHASVKAKGHK